MKSMSIEKCENGYLVNYIDQEKRSPWSGEDPHRRKVFINLEQLLAFIEGYLEGGIRVPGGPGPGEVPE